MPGQRPSVRKGGSAGGTDRRGAGRALQLESSKSWRRKVPEVPLPSGGTRPPISLSPLDRRLGSLRWRGRGPRDSLRRGGLWQDHGLVFPSTVGTPMLGGNLIRDFKALLKRVRPGSPARFHDLRHTRATLLLRQGVNPKFDQDLLGHGPCTKIRYCTKNGNSAPKFMLGYRFSGVLCGSHVYPRSSREVDRFFVCVQLV